MADTLTLQQKTAVEDRGGKLLVSAAAGSGKTKVLVERLMRYLTDVTDPANIDDFLIITYTKAAAAELRGKIASRLSELVAQQPDNRHLQRQMQRLYLTKISTVHSFCTELLRENAYRLDIPGDFRVAEENETTELQERAISLVMEKSYEMMSDDLDFRYFLDTQGLGRDDRAVPEIVRSVYNSARCHLDPEKWLQWCIDANDTNDVQDASETLCGQYLIRDLHGYLDLQIQSLDRCYRQAILADQMDKPADLLQDTISQLQRLRNCEKWDDVIRCMDIDYGRLSFSKKCTDAALVEQIKAVRDACKKGVAAKLRKFNDDSQQILADIRDYSAAVRGLVQLVNKFSETYTGLKLGRRVLDFGDLEHLALDLLLGKKRNGVTSIALETGRRYREVMVDEYQDSNAVQDAIFESLTKEKNNCFMVGDVKQSIYQFRLADPGIFLDKYNTYVHAEEASDGQGRKVLLSSNFRSSAAVISAVNDVFNDCMSVPVGGLDYGEDEALVEGVPKEPLSEPEVELHCIEAQDDAYGKEADFIAKRICQLLDKKHMIRVKNELREIRPEDIVILLRSPGSVGGVYASRLSQCGIRCSFGGSVDILKTEEVQVLRAVLQIIDNPYWDIPFVAALTSRVFGFTADELAQVRSRHRNIPFYEAVMEDDQPKCVAFAEIFHSLRGAVRKYDLTGLIQFVLLQTKLDSIFAAAENGNMRTENLQAFCQLAGAFDAGSNKSLGSFLKHLEALDASGVPGLGEKASAGAVTIMSIHKSKGLEFPVVFLSGLSRGFNRESLYNQVLCHKDLGIGLSCVDGKNRVRYPSLAKRAIAAKMNADGISEEMRVLYVAMTRPECRLIMTYSDKKIQDMLQSMISRMVYSQRQLMTADVDCPGKWVLYSALHRQEAGALFDQGERPEALRISKHPWKITVVQSPSEEPDGVFTQDSNQEGVSSETVERLRRGLAFRYGHMDATVTPSKITATQLKGRSKDVEAAENAAATSFSRHWRRAGTQDLSGRGRDYGNAMHAVMQYISFGACHSVSAVSDEIKRLKESRLISPEQAELADPKAIAKFFETEIGQKLLVSEDVLREFKFSILDRPPSDNDQMQEESVLLQGVVDCALIEPDGITVIDFKTDKTVSADVSKLIAKYRQQVSVYAMALSRIYQMPVKETYLYFFSAGKLCSVQLH